jgi:hypothetical protein
MSFLSAVELHTILGICRTGRPTTGLATDRWLQLLGNDFCTKHVAAEATLEVEARAAAMAVEEEDLRAKM